MAIAITHTKVSGVADSANSQIIQPSDWNAALATSIATKRLVGRTTASTGPFEEISVASSLTFSGGVLSANSSYFYPNINISGYALVYSNDAGATVGPSIYLYRDSASPAANDFLGEIVFQGEDSGGNQHDYASITSLIGDPTNGSEDGVISFRTSIAGTPTEAAALGSNGTTGYFILNNGYQVLQRNDDSAAAGPYFYIKRLTASPAAADILGIIDFQGVDSGANTTDYAYIYAYVNDPTNGSEDGSIIIDTIINGTAANRLNIGDGLVVGAATGGYPGNSQINATGYRINGTSIFATASDQETATSTTTAVTPAEQHRHPSAAKVWVCGTPNSTTIKASYNVTSLGDTATGQQTVTIANDFSSVNYCVLVTVGETSTTVAKSATVISKAVGSYVMNSVVEAGSGSDPTTDWNSVGFGDL